MQPAKFLPITEYKLVVGGLTTTEDKVAPVLQVYDEAPEAVNVADLPEHIVEIPDIAMVDVFIEQGAVTLTSSKCIKAAPAAALLVP